MQLTKNRYDLFSIGIPLNFDKLFLFLSKYNDIPILYKSYLYRLFDWWNKIIILLLHIPKAWWIFMDGICLSNIGKVKSVLAQIMNEVAYLIVYRKFCTTLP